MKCDECGNEVQVDLPMSDRDKYVGKTCGECNDGLLYRVPGCAGFQLKGHCWASDGYATTVGDKVNFEN